MNLRNKRIAILGGGLQGACVAMELAADGASIDLYERNDFLVAETSANNEGKVHLGYVYAYDKTFKTARIMIDGALCFERLLRKWLGETLNDLPTSSPFRYLVHRNGLLTPEEFEAHALRTTAMICAEYDEKRTQYFGRDLRQPLRRLNEQTIIQNSQNAPIVAAFQTEEIGIDPEALSFVVRQRILQIGNINSLTGRTVTKVKRVGTEFLVQSHLDHELTIDNYDFVVNALGPDRLRIDASLGIPPKRPWTYRLKYFLRAKSVHKIDLCSATMVLGAFGDIVNYGNGSLYFSWYPAGLSGWSNDLYPPHRPLFLEGVAANEMHENILRGLANVVPEIEDIQLREIAVNGGWIFSYGSTDINNRNSGFHERYDVGVQHRGRYLTIDTGKLTLAPMFAERAANVLRSTD